MKPRFLPLVAAALLTACASTAQTPVVKPPTKPSTAETPPAPPAHWLPNRWGQDWSAMVDVKGLNLDAVLAKKGAEWQAKQGERFYQSLGFPALPVSFWEKSSLYPLPKGAAYRKNNHASV